jgi:hypothetical protein
MVYVARNIVLEVVAQLSRRLNFDFHIWDCSQLRSP